MNVECFEVVQLLNSLLSLPQLTLFGVAEHSVKNQREIPHIKITKKEEETIFGLYLKKPLSVCMH